MEIATQATNVINTRFAGRPGLTYAEAADVLSTVTGVKVTVATIKTYIKAGKLTTFKVSTFRLVNIESLKALKFDAPAPRPASAKKPAKKAAPATGAAT